MTNISPEIGIILCSIAGLVLILLESIMPGFGIAGIMGILAEIGAIVIAWVNLGPLPALYVFLALGVLTGLLVFLAFRSLKKGKLNRFVLKEDEKSFHSSESMDAYIGKIGVTRSVLRPVGIIEIDGKRMDAQSEGEFLPKDVEIVVTHVNGNKLFVNKK